jgi:hypothetical protein
MPLLFLTSRLRWMQKNVSGFRISVRGAVESTMDCEQVSNLQLCAGTRLSAEADVPGLAKAQRLLTAVACWGNAG